MSIPMLSENYKKAQRVIDAFCTACKQERLETSQMIEILAIILSSIPVIDKKTGKKMGLEEREMFLIEAFSIEFADAWEILKTHET